jgi:hypothetical protein
VVGRCGSIQPIDVVGSTSLEPPIGASPGWALRGGRRVGRWKRPRAPRRRARSHGIWSVGRGCVGPDPDPDRPGYRRWRTAGPDPPSRHRSAGSRLSPRSRPPAASTGLVMRAEPTSLGRARGLLLAMAITVTDPSRVALERTQPLTAGSRSAHGSLAVQRPRPGSPRPQLPA